MPSIKDLKKRIVSTKNTQQTTKAMKMVSAAKLRRAQDAILSNRPYAKAISALIEQLLALPETQVKSRLLSSDEFEREGGKNLLLLVVTSDRGLCGGFNSNIIRYAGRWVKENSPKYGKITLAFLGKRGFDFFKTKRVNVGTYFEECGGKVTFTKAKKLTNNLIGSFESGEFDEVKILYNEFKNAISQQITLENFLPLKPSALPKGADVDAAQRMVIIKPGATEVVNELIEKHFVGQVFRVMLESQAGEHGARMSAMENATKNAGEMIKKLNLQYNKQRQAGITKELLEIISGSESQKSA